MVAKEALHVLPLQLSEVVVRVNEAVRGLMLVAGSGESGRHLL
jgi:hypothetical protein